MITILSNEQSFELWNSFRDKCNKCNHNGYTLSSSGEFEWCDCYISYRERKQLMESGISARYYNWDIKDLDENFLLYNKEEFDKFINVTSNIEDLIENGKSMVMQGPHGLAKTALSSWLVKKAALIRVNNSNQIEYKYICSIVTAADLSSILIQAQSFESDKSIILDRIRNSNLIVIDEFDKEYKLMDKSRFSGLEFGNLFNYLYESNKSIIIISNLSISEIRDAKIHASDVLDRIDSFEYNFVFRGESYRKRRKKRKNSE